MAFSAFAAVDATRSSFAAPNTEPVALTALLLFAYVLPWFVVAGALLAAGYSGMSWLVRRAGFSFSAPDAQCRGTDRALGLIPAATVVFATANGAAFITASRFNNLKLGALLVAVAVLASLALAVTAWASFVLLATWIRKRSPNKERQASVLVFVSAIIAPLAVAAWVTSVNWAGFKILGGWLFAGPAVAVVLFLILRTLRRPRVRPRWRTAAFAVIALGALVAANVRSDLPAVAESSGLWSHTTLRGARALTDFDRDGYSAFFGGGDCAPLNSSIHPGAREIADDGIDNNCLDGSGSDELTAPPTWFEGLAPPARNLIVITVEALRGDRLSVTGYERDITSNLDALAQRGFTFRQTYSATSSTRLSLAAFWSSQVASTITWERQRGRRSLRMHESTPWIPTMLSRAGFHTIAVLPRWQGFTKREAIGYSRGFTTYDATIRTGTAPDGFRGFSATKLVARARDHIKKGQPNRFALWIHLVEPHSDYERYPGSPDFGTSKVDLYDTEIWGVDQQIGQLIDSLERDGLLNETVVFITGDHGEAFGEHGKWAHGTLVHEPQVRTVGILWAPGLPGKVIDTPVVHQDFGPTLMNLLGVKEGFEKLRGRNLAPVLRGHAPERSSFVVESFHEIRHSAYRAALIDWPYKFTHTQSVNRSHLYNLDTDPEELKDIKKERSADFERLRSQYVGFFEATSKLFIP